MGTSNYSVNRELEAFVREYFPRDTEQVLADFYAKYPRPIRKCGSRLTPPTREAIAEVVAKVQNVPFVGPKQLKIASAVLALLAVPSTENEETP